MLRFEHFAVFTKNPPEGQDGHHLTFANSMSAIFFKD
jgi:hypothetical protein